MIEKMIPVTGFERNSDAEYIASLLRWTFMRNFQSVRVVGLNIITGQRGKGLEEIATLAGSTDIALDVAVRLSSASYEVTNKVYQLLNGDTGESIDMDVKGEGSARIGVIRVIKRFDQSRALTYGDLADYFTFFDGKPDTIIANSMYQGDITFEFYVQLVRKTQDELNNRLNLNYVFGENSVKIAVPSRATVGIDMYIREANGVVNLCIQTYEGDTRAQDLEQRFRNSLVGIRKVLSEF